MKNYEEVLKLYYGDYLSSAREPISDGNDTVERRQAGTLMLPTAGSCEGDRRESVASFEPHKIDRSSRQAIEVDLEEGKQELVLVQTEFEAKKKWEYERQPSKQGKILFVIGALLSFFFGTWSMTDESRIPETLFFLIATAHVWFVDVRLEYNNPYPRYIRAAILGLLLAFETGWGMTMIAYDLFEFHTMFMGSICFGILQPDSALRLMGIYTGGHQSLPQMCADIIQKRDDEDIV